MLYYKKLPLLFLGTISTLLGVSSEVLAAHLGGIDRNDPRTDLPNQGYLAFGRLGGARPFTHFGEEWTGWIDIRHPAMDGTEDLREGFDRSDHFVNVHSKVVTDGSVPAQPAKPNIQRDFNFANKVYAQAGLSVVNTATVPVVERGVTFPLNSDERTTVVSNNRVGGVNVNNYYVGSFDSPDNGITRFPAGNPGKHGMLIADRAQNSTFAHELGHMLLNVGNPGHSADQQNFFFGTGSNYAFENVGSTAGKMTSAQIETIFSNPRPNNPGFVQRRDNHPAGDRVDWDFVADQLKLESIPLADNHPKFQSLFWGINTTQASNHADQKHDGLGNFQATPDFAGQSFRTVDVFSLITRYSDFEIDGAGNPLLRDRSLDYDLSFVGANGQTVPGTLIDVFTPGWTDNTNVDNYLGRWLSPIDAVGIFVAAHNGNSHDGTAQIDAVIASDVKAKDFGDAPDSYKTLLQSDGPRYDEGFFQRLGAQWDSETDGQHTPLANGDDRSLLGGIPKALEDEDGVMFGDRWVDVIFNIGREGANNYQLRAWWDKDKDNCFDHLTDPNCQGNELFINDLFTLNLNRLDMLPPGFVSLGSGLFQKRYNLGFDPTDYFSRFRFTWDPLDLDVKPWGEYFSKADCSSSTAGCISHGEVEDYAPRKVVPEPSTLFGLVTVLGLGAFFNPKAYRKHKKE